MLQVQTEKSDLLHHRTYKTPPDRNKQRQQFCGTCRIKRFGFRAPVFLLPWMHWMCPSSVVIVNVSPGFTCTRITCRKQNTKEVSCGVGFLIFNFYFRNYLGGGEKKSLPYPPCVLYRALATLKSEKARWKTLMLARIKCLWQKPSHFASSVFSSAWPHLHLKLPLIHLKEFTKVFFPLSISCCFLFLY